MRAWLKNCRVTEIAMESTGQYWRPLWNLLEGEFPKLLLVNPQHIKGLNGYKTDPKDAQWIAGLLEGGRLKGSWVPPRPIRELRDLTRQRVNLLEDLNRAKNRIEQLCQSGNIKITSVATDLFGVSGRKMLKALIEAKRDPGWMADYVKGKLRSRRGELELALQGTFTDEQRWLLEKELLQVEFLELQIETLEREIERRVAVFEESIQRLLTIPGIDRKTAWTIVAEVGVDLSAFPRCQAPGQLGGPVSGQPRKRRQADEWAHTQGQPLCETGHVPGGVGGVPYQGHLPVRVLPPDGHSQGSSQGRYGIGSSHDAGSSPTAQPQGGVR